MTRKDFVLIARVLHRATPTKGTAEQTVYGHGYDYGRKSEHEAVCEFFADALGGTNPQFDRERFLKACREGC